MTRQTIMINLIAWKKGRSFGSIMITANSNLDCFIMGHIVKIAHHSEMKKQSQSLITSPVSKDQSANPAIMSATSKEPDQQPHQLN